MSDSIYVARQPLLTATSEVFGYELLYRATSQAEACVDRKDVAAARVLTDSLLSIGLGDISGGRPVFLNLTRSLLLQDLSTLLKPQSVVLEILEEGRPEYPPTIGTILSRELEPQSSIGTSD